MAGRHSKSRKDDGTNQVSYVEACVNCKYSNLVQITESNEPDLLYVIKCHRYPPMCLAIGADDFYHNFQFPEVDFYSWCGCFQPSFDRQLVTDLDSVAHYFIPVEDYDTCEEDESSKTEESDSNVSGNQIRDQE